MLQIHLRDIKSPKTMGGAYLIFVKFFTNTNLFLSFKFIHLKIHFGKIHLGRKHFGKIHFRKYTLVEKKAEKVEED